MLQIFGKSSSINVRKVLWTCAEIGISYEHVEFGSGTSNSTQSPEFLALNPNAMVPVLRDEFGTLWESNTICRYLAARYQRLDLLPIDPMARAQVEKWMDWQASDLNSAWRYVFMGLVRQHPHFQAPDKMLDSATQWNRLMTIFDQHLQRGGPYAADKHFTLADVVLGLSINRWRSTPIEHAQLRHVDAYFDLLCERPAFLQFGANGTP
ncbi:glutathione S-transferase family protein [Undibacterium cyanobacteriorum]|uniref:Glutathione S-transferase family protein n=1 Tax=Undibacterium cyanobacteriorum TaxID=3073561 RepID=A0ABY9RDQ1_9BURK|nr:glutathione S-transferase family protein [Undibacterium sp. 20NA77.5]WMW79338.1 glutathione S-transferase family protein [Undibacterium sp. 20NA77.5]